MRALKLPGKHFGTRVGSAAHETPGEALPFDVGPNPHGLHGRCKPFAQPGFPRAGRAVHDNQDWGRAAHEAHRGGYPPAHPLLHHAKLRR